MIEKFDPYEEYRGAHLRLEQTQYEVNYVIKNADLLCGTFITDIIVPYKSA